MKYIPDKPYKSISEQITLLKNRGLVIENEFIATKLLNTIGYYTLINGYGKIYLANNDHFKPNVKIEYIYAQYLLDKKLQKIILPRIFDCEDYLKNTLAHIISEHHGVNEKDHSADSLGYLNRKKYRIHSKTMPVLKSVVERINTTKKNPTSYYRIKKNHIPPWIAFRNIDFWHANGLFASLLPSHKNEATEKLLDKKELFNQESQIKIITDGYELLREFRNIAAHGSVLHSFKSHKAIPKIALTTLFGEGSVSSKSYKSVMGLNDLYGLFLTLLIFLPNQEDKINLVNELHSIQKPYFMSNDSSDMVTYNDFCQTSNLPVDFTKKLFTSLDIYLNN